MSTYTDLHNRVKENVTVDYNNRVTPQKVKFLNEENEFWGTFKGTATIENPTIVNASITDTVIQDSILKNSMLCSDTFGIIDIGQIQIECENLSNTVCKQLQQNDQYLSSQISSLSASKDEQKDNINYLSSCVSANYNELTDAILSIYDNDSILSGIINTKISNEISDRISNDNELFVKICKLSADLSTDISNLNVNILDTIQLERHHDITQLYENDCPMKASEFAVNVLQTYTLGDYFVKEAGQPETTSFAKIVDQDLTSETISATLRINSSIGEYDTAFKPGTDYHFTDSEEFETKTDYVCKLTYNDEEKSWSGYAKIAASEKYVLNDETGQVLGIITDFERDSDNKLKSGKLTVNSISYLSVFNTTWWFDITDSSKTRKESDDGKHIITYCGENLFRFDYNVTAKKYTELTDSIDSTVFGKIIESNVKKTDANEISSIKIRLTNSSITSDVELLSDYAFDKQVSYGGNLIDIKCDPTTVDKSNVTLTELHIQYAYKTDSLISASLSANENKTIHELDNTSKIYVDLTNFDGEDDFKKSYELTASENNLFTCICADSTQPEQQYIKISCDITDSSDMHIDIYYKTVSETTETKKHVSIIDTPYITNYKVVDKVRSDNASHVILYKTSNNVDLTFTKDVKTDILAEYTFNPTLTYKSQSYSKDLNTFTNGIDKINIQIPNKSIKSTKSREFLFVLNVSSAAFDKVEVEFVNEAGDKLEYYHEYSSTLFVPTNKYVTLTMKEVLGDKFLIIDNEQSWQDSRINEISSKVLAVSVDLSAKYGELSTAISSNVDKIDDLYKQIKGGLNYQGMICLSSNYDKFFNLFAANFGGSTEAERIAYKETKYRNGFFWVVSADSTTKHYTVEGKEIEYADWLVINKNISAGELSNSNVDVHDSMDKDTFRLSADEQVIAGHNYYTGLQELSVLSAGILSAHEIIADKFHAAEVDIDKNISVQNVSATAIYADYAYLSNSTLTSVSAANITADNLSILTADVTCLTSDQLSANQMFATSSYITYSNATSANIESLSAASAYIDAKKLYVNGVSSLNDICADLQEQIISNDNDISVLSSKVHFLLSVDKETMNYKGILPKYEPTDPSIPANWKLSEFIKPLITPDVGYYDLKLGDMFKLSATQSCLYDATTVNHEYFGAKDFFVMNKDVKDYKNIKLVDIDIFRNAETEYESLCISLSTTTRLSVEDLQRQIISNDNDITFLSSDLSTLEYNHYKKNLSIDLSVECNKAGYVPHTYVVDQLILLDEVTFDRYRLTMRNGTFHLCKIDNVLTAV